jgi:hypothetical protein
MRGLSNVNQRSVRIVVGTLVAFILLVATHRGEFWPFSIYPMFSQAGRPWSRTVVRSLPAGTTAADIDWSPARLQDLPGEAFAAEAEDIEAIDLANYVIKTKDWNAERLWGLHHMFADKLEGRTLLVVRVDGIVDDEEIMVRFMPYVLLTPAGAILTPELDPGS